MTVAQWADAVRTNVSKVMKGKQDVIDKMLIALLCGGHVLLEDVPGVGKTILARALSASLGGSFARLQCTPDLMPADVLGVSVFHPDSASFVFTQGPIFANVVLVDEINRTTPRNQSALLEAMQSGSVTVDGTTRPLPQPFFLMATENPLEFEGTFPLPDAQRDRFFLCASVGYPDEASELAVLADQNRTSHPVSDLGAVTEPREILAARIAVSRVQVPEQVENLILDLVRRTRNDQALRIGASPRGSISLYQGVQALAAIRGRGKANESDVTELAMPVLWKRVGASAASLFRGQDERKIITDILKALPFQANA